LELSPFLSEEELGVEVDPERELSSFLSEEELGVEVDSEGELPSAPLSLLPESARLLE
jgi:hypothetical protein